MPKLRFRYLCRRIVSYYFLQKFIGYVSSLIYGPVKDSTVTWVPFLTFVQPTLVTLTSNRGSSKFFYTNCLRYTRYDFFTKFMLGPLVTPTSRVRRKIGHIIARLNNLDRRVYWTSLPKLAIRYYAHHVAWNTRHISNYLDNKWYITILSPL